MYFLINPIIIMSIVVSNQLRYFGINPSVNPLLADDEGPKALGIFHGVIFGIWPTKMGIAMDMALW